MKRIEIFMIAAFMLFVQFGCTDGGGCEIPGGNDDSGSVSIQINKEKLVVDESARARSTEEPSGNEGKITSLSFYFFDASGVKVYEKQFTSSDLSDNSTQPNWISKGIIKLPESIKPTIAKATSVYVVANASLIGVINKAALLNMQASDLPQNNTGNFIMEGHHENEVALNPNVAPMVTVQLRRMAAKVRLHVTLGAPGTGEITAVQRWETGLRYWLRNQIISGYVVENKHAKLSDSNHTSDNVTNFYDGGITPVNIVTYGGDLPVMEKYTYEHYLRETNDDMTYILLQLPYWDNETNAVVTHNYYKVLLDKVGIQRNKIYEVSVVINDIGSLYSDLPVEIQPSHVEIVDWINVNIGADIVNDYLYVPGTLFKMYGDKISFNYKASNKPGVYLTSRMGTMDEEYFTLPADEANADVSDYSKGEGTAHIFRKQLDRFAEEVPRLFYAYFHVRSIVKPITIEQYPSSYFGKDETGSDYYHIITPKDTKEYPIGYTINYNQATNEYTTSIHEVANMKVSPDFYIYKLNAGGGDTENMYPKQAEDYCLKMQKATDKIWTLPTVRQWQLVAEACRRLEAKGITPPVPYGNYSVAQRSDTYYGYGVNIPSGEIVDFTYGGPFLKTRCVRNAE